MARAMERCASAKIATDIFRYQPYVEDFQIATTPLFPGDATVAGHGAIGHGETPHIDSETSPSITLCASLGFSPACQRAAL